MSETQTPGARTAAAAPAARNGMGRFVIAAGLVLALMAAAGIAAVQREWRASVAAREWVDHTYQVIDDIRRLFDDVQDAETGARGYVITGDPAYLDPYNEGSARLDGDRDRLRAAISDNGDELRRFALVDSLIDKKMNVLERAVTGRKVGSPPQVYSGGGRVLMVEVRRVIDEMVADERALLAARNAERERSTRANLQIVVAAFVIAVLAIGIAIVLAAAYLHRRRVAEAATRAQATLLAATLEGMGLGIGVHDAELRLLLWNQRYQEYSGLKVSDFAPGVTLPALLRTAAAVGDFGSAADAEAWIAERTRILEARVPYEAERVRPDGTVLLIRGTFTEDGLGVTTFADITTLKTIERDLKANVARLRAIFDNTLDGIITINESGSIESFNPAAERTFGYEAAELLGRNIKILMPEPYRGHHDGYLRDYRQSNIKKIIGQRRELEGMRKDGTAFPIELSINEFISGGKRLFVGMVRDISERRQVERLKGEFVSTVSHELRTPLTSIAGSLGLLWGGTAGELSEKAKRLVEIANKNSIRLVRLVNDILDLDKIESGRMKFAFAPVALKPLVEACMEANRGYAEEYKVRFVLDPSAADGVVLADADRITQVLANLLSNAAKFSPTGGVVTVGVEQRGYQLRVSVGDEGPGIPDEFRAMIFQKFAQADSKDNRRKGGTGLGLSIARSITERHGGALSFDSEPGRGSTFYMDLPQWEEGVEQYVAADSATAAAAADEGAAELPLGRPLRVLHVEDDTDVGRVVGFALEGLAEVTGARTLAEGRRQLETAAFDLMILDIALPDGSGLSLLSIARHRPQESMPVIVFSSQEVDVQWGAEVKAVLTKSKASAIELRRVVLDIARALPSRPMREAGE